MNIDGTVEEFNDNIGTDTLSAIKALAITAATGTAAIAPVTNVPNKTAAELSVAAAGEPCEARS